MVFHIITMYTLISPPLNKYVECESVNIVPRFSLEQLFPLFFLLSGHLYISPVWYGPFISLGAPTNNLPKWNINNNYIQLVNIKKNTQDLNSNKHKTIQLQPKGYGEADLVSEHVNIPDGISKCLPRRASLGHLHWKIYVQKTNQMSNTSSDTQTKRMDGTMLCQGPRSNTLSLREL